MKKKSRTKRYGLPSIDDVDAIDNDLRVIRAWSDLLELVAAAHSEPDSETLETVGEQIRSAAKRIHQRVCGKDAP